MNWNSSLFAASIALSVLGCGGSDSPPIGKRFAHQDMTNAVGAPMQSWDYAYDSLGRFTQLQGYDAAGAWVTTATHAYANGVRTGTTTRAPAGTLMNSVEYGYVGGVLDSATRRNSTGAVYETAVYVFEGGRKLSTTRYLPAGGFIDRRAFHYDPVSGDRTGSTVYDSLDAVIGSSTRTYVGGLLTEVEVVSGGGTTYRFFTYEDGLVVGGAELFFEY